MASLTQDSNGNYKARKRLPRDVRVEYGRLYGPRLEAKFSRKADTKPHVARREFHEWLSDVESKIANIRAQRNGEGQSLTRQQARGLAGEWYDWFIAQHPLAGKGRWEHLRDSIHEAVRELVGDKTWEANEEPDEFFREDEEVRKAMRPLLADAGQTAQFLAIKRIALNNEAQNQFLDFLYEDLSEALKRLMRISDSDYSRDEYRERFPKFEGSDSGDTPWQLFEKWVAERKPQASSIESWRSVFRAMNRHFKDRSASSITPDEAQKWIAGLVTKERSGRTVRKTWITASKTVFGWAFEHKRVPRNHFKEVKVTIAKKHKLRDTQAFYPQEYRKILKGALAVKDVSTPFGAARRWVPWLLAYTGARPGEITQLRKCDVIARDGVHALHLTPEAGSIKSGKARTVPLHRHLIAQGFLKFTQACPEGPLFYKPGPRAQTHDGVRTKKARAAQIRQRLAKWVRDLGLADKALSPNHAWRHTFKQVAAREGITDRMSDTITGHTHKSVGASYGAPTLEDMANAMKKFPRYDLE